MMPPIGTIINSPKISTDPKTGIAIPSDVDIGHAIEALPRLMADWNEKNPSSMIA